MISDLTYKVVAYSEVQQLDLDECVDWAIEMLELGYETPSLLILAGTSKPMNYFEVVDYLRKSLDELGLKAKEGQEAVLSYASYYIKQIAEKKDIRKSLKEVYKFCQARDYEDTVHDFYLLYWAWDDLDYEDKSYNPYWEGVTRSNIEDTVVKVAQDWAHNNEKYFSQQCT